MRSARPHIVGLGLAFVLLAMVIVTYFNFVIEDEIAEPSYPISKHLRYSFNLRNSSDQFIEHSIFKAFAPVRQTSSQLVKSLYATHPYTLSVDRFGNQVMEFVIDALPPYGSKVITVTAAMQLSTTPNRLEVDVADYLSNSELLDIDHPDIVAEATRLSAKSEIPLGEVVYKWVSENLRYSGFEKDDKGALYALQTKSGDCTEYSQLVTALLRQQGIPARAVGGFVTGKAQQVLRAADYHNWTEYLAAEGWVLADAQKKVHNSTYEKYIAFRIIEKDAGDPMSNSHRFLAFDPRLSVSMN